MQEIATGILSGLVVALVFGMVLYRIFTKSMENKLHHYMEALAGIKGEVDRFEAALGNVQKRLDQTGRELESLVGVRTRQLKKKLELFEGGKNP